MNLHDEIAKTAYELYEKSGKVDGKDLENWQEAERIVQARYTNKELPKTTQVAERRARQRRKI